MIENILLKLRTKSSALLVLPGLKLGDEKPPIDLPLAQLLPIPC
jgi:hypothetical protein